MGVILVLIGILFFLVSVILSIKNLIKKKHQKNAIIFLFSGFVIFMIGFILVPTEKKDSNNEKNNVEVSDKSFVMNDAQKKAFDNLNNFSLFVNSYKEIPLTERTPLWENKLYKSNVTWSGTIIGTGGLQIYLIDSEKYLDGMTFDNVSGTENDFYVFVARFDEKINKTDYQIGQQATFTGNLQSRGSDGQSQYEKQPGTFAHWKIYNAVQE